MKTSNKLLAALAIIIVIGMTSFTILLKAEYKKAAAKSDISKQEIKLKAFDKLEVSSENGVDISIEEGANYSIKNAPNAKVIGSTLKIDSLTDVYGKVIITMPKLPAITLKGNEIAVNIKGNANKFANNTLQVNSTATGDLNLSNCDLTNLNITAENAVIEYKWMDSWQRYYHFHLVDSKVASTDITLKGKASLSLKNTSIVSPTFNLSDSASISIEGNAMNPFVKK